ncbi:uncharacterized protein LAJ45_08125 [Morchella importuna]|uniref:uncharacterized protein n=1 Tax=Morchella importuna TaxID=1174673 RepID=UPI001E8EB36F|nr:uncharacterized protein LAJ45_08125 [Morchella importuna]KAH8147661.1 hypothetical protein LAJ45_08125 [Morchella importuna]
MSYGSSVPVQASPLNLSHSGFSAHHLARAREHRAQVNPEFSTPRLTILRPNPSTTFSVTYPRTYTRLL